MSERAEVPAKRISHSSKSSHSSTKNRENRERDRDREIDRERDHREHRDSHDHRESKHHKESRDLRDTKDRDSVKPDSPSGNKSSKSQPIIDSKDVGLIPTFPLIRIQDNVTALPKYSAVLTWNKEELIGMDEMDYLQLELESLLSTMSQRNRLFNSIVKSMDKVDEKRDSRGKPSDRTSQSSGKKKRSDDRHMKSSEDSFSSSRSSSSHHNKIPKIKNLASIASSSAHSTLSSQSIEEFNLDLSNLPRRSVPKNDTSFKFWMSTDQFCGYITQPKVDRLAALIELVGEPLPTIPELGPHYRVCWPNMDIWDQQNSLNPVSAKQKRNDMNMNIPPDIATMLKKSDLLKNDTPGPITQRLMSALFEVPVNKPNYEKIQPTENSSCCTVLKNGVQLERRHCKELVDMGLLDDDDFPKPSQNDDILDEMKIIQSELKKVNSENIKKLRHLYSTSISELPKAELTMKVNNIDKEILNSYKKLLIAKQKEMPFDEKRQDDLYKLMKEQVILNEKLQLLPSSRPYYP